MKAMPNKYTHDIIVIGAGSGGLTCAIFMQRAGFRVLLIDKAPETFGGDCLNYGCIPSKALLHVANLFHDIDTSSKYSSHDQAHTVDIQKVMDYIKERQAVIRKHENPEYIKTLGIDIAIGNARFSGEHDVIVDGNHYTAKHIVIATGSRPRTLELEGLESIPHYTNESIFSIKRFPKDFVFIGGGPINIELGQAFSRLGSHVTILQTGERILPKEEPEVAVLLQRLLEKEGISIRTGVAVEKIENGQVFVKTPDGSVLKISADAVFVGVGRVPNIDSLALETAGIKLDDHNNLQLDKYLRTTNKAVSAVGDAAGQHMFTHAAELQASVVLRNFFSPFKKKYTAKHMAWTTFTRPEVATFGINKLQLGTEAANYDELIVHLDEDDRAITDDSTEGFLKLYLSKQGLVLGGTMVGPRAGEITSELILMMYEGIKLDAVLSKPFPYPIGSRVIQAAARQYSGKKLQSPFAKRILRLLYH